MGIGQFKAGFSKIFKNEYNDLILRVVDRGASLSTHSDYVTLLVVYGFVGLSLYLFYLFKNLVKLFFKIRYADTPELRQFHQFSLTILAVVAVFGFAAENFLNPQYWLLLALSTTSIYAFEKPEAAD